jgi:hypothetical protein
LCQQFRHRCAGFIEELIGPVGAKPAFQRNTVIRIFARRGKRYLVRPERAFDLLAVDDRWAGPALGVRSTIIGQAA